MIPGAVHRFPGVCVTAEDTSRKPDLEDHLMKAVLSVFASNEVPYLQMESAGSHSPSGGEKEEKKGGF